MPVRKAGRGTLFLFWTALLMVALFLMTDPALCGALVKKGIDIAVKGALPSVFPYLVLSSLFFESGFPLLFKGRIARLFGRLFYLPEVCISGIAVGLFAGFPMGANFAAGLFNGGYCTKEQAERLAALSNFCAPPFLLGAFGQGVMGTPMAGLLLYLVQTGSVFFYGIFLGRNAKKREKRTLLAGNDGTSLEREATPSALDERSVPSLFAMAGSCIGKSALQMVRICGFILTFSLLSGLILRLFSSACARFTPLEGLIAGFFEISAGVANLRERGAAGMFFGALGLCWSGISVHMQVAGFLSPAGLSSKAHLLAHLRLSPIVAIASAFLFAVLKDALDLF